MLALHTSLEPTPAVRPALQLHQLRRAMERLLLLDTHQLWRLVTEHLHQAMELPRPAMVQRPRRPTDNLQPKTRMR